MLKFNSNGFYIKAIEKGTYGDYDGVEGDSWFQKRANIDLPKDKCNNWVNYYRENIDKNWADSNWCDLIVDKNILCTIVDLCCQYNIVINVYYCLTTKLHPSMCNNLSENICKKQFIGFDYSYAGGDFYSCVFSEIYSGRIKEFSNYKLNRNGLFETESEITSYIEKRKLIAQNDKLRFEQGDMTIYKLWKCDLQSLIDD